MIIRRRFRPLGRLLQRFGRLQINNYTHVTNLASRAEVPPAWEDTAQEPLVWTDPDVSPAAESVSSEAAPAVQREAEPELAPEAPLPPGQRRTPRDLWLI